MAEISPNIADPVLFDGTHLVAYVNHPRVEIVCGSSRDEGRRTRFAARVARGVRTYADWREMLYSSDLDIVSVATYTAVISKKNEVNPAVGKGAVRPERNTRGRASNITKILVCQIKNTKNLKFRT